MDACNKKSYRSVTEAMRFGIAMNRTGRLKRLQTGVYWCLRCQAFHLTSHSVDTRQSYVRPIPG